MVFNNPKSHQIFLIRLYGDLLTRTKKIAQPGHTVPFQKVSQFSDHGAKEEPLAGQISSPFSIKKGYFVRPFFNFILKMQSSLLLSM